jgi:urea transport system permease protein
LLRLIVGLVLACSINNMVLAGGDDSLAARLDALAAAKLSKMPAQIDLLAGMDDPRAAVVLQALLDGQLYARKSDKRLFIATPAADKSLLLTDPLGLVQPGAAKKNEFKRIAVNNRMRSQLRYAIARANLHSPDPLQRQAAVLRLLDDLDPAVLVLLDEAAEDESDEGVLGLVYIARGMIALDSDDRLEKIAAIELLSGNLQPLVKNRLQQVLAKRRGWP